MRQLYGWVSLASLCGLFSAVSDGADPAPAARFVPQAAPQRATAPTAAPHAHAPVPQGTKSVTPAKPVAPTFAERMQAVQQQQRQQQAEEDNRPKPTQWQMQNPANPANHRPTLLTGTIAPNNYFGADFHSWSNVSQPAPMTQLPFNQTATTPLTQTNLYTAPNVYFGNQYSGWSNLRSGTVEPNPFGGWNYR